MRMEMMERGVLTFSKLRGKPPCLEEPDCRGTDILDFRQELGLRSSEGVSLVGIMLVLGDHNTSNSLT